MAVKGPRAWVIGIILQNDESGICCRAGLDELYIPTLRIMRISYDAVPGSCTFGEHVEVVAVKMHRVGGPDFVVNYEADGGIGAEVVHIPLGVGVRKVACVGEREDGVASHGSQSLINVWYPMDRRLGSKTMG